MEGSEQGQRPHGSSETARNHSKESEMHEDTEFSDLPVHFQSAEGERKGGSSTTVLQIPKSTLSHQSSGSGQSNSHNNQPALSDASTQHYDGTTLLTPRYPPPLPLVPPPSLQGNNNKVDSGCQYSPNDIGHHLFPSTSLTDNHHPSMGSLLYPTSFMDSLKDRQFVAPDHHSMKERQFATPIDHSLPKDRQFTSGRDFYPTVPGGQPHVQPGGFYGLGPEADSILGKMSLYGLAGMAGLGNSAATAGHGAGLYGSHTSLNGYGGMTDNSARHPMYPATSPVGGESNSRTGGPGHQPLGGDRNSSASGSGARGNTSGGFSGSHNQPGGGGGGSSSSGGQGHRGNSNSAFSSGGRSHGGGSKTKTSSVGIQVKNGETQTPAAKPYQCPECDATFTRVDHLSRHLRTQKSHFHSAMDKGPSSSQTPAQYHPCPYCGKLFMRQDHMKRHSKIHTRGETVKSTDRRQDKSSSGNQGPVQYHPCPHCNKLFTRRDHMKRHSKIHARGEPVKCVECLVWFPTKGELNRHLLDAHNIQVFECSQCGKGFLQADFLTRHLRDKHGMAEDGNGRFTQVANGATPVSPQALQAPYRCGICCLYFTSESESTAHMVLHARPNSRPATTPLPLGHNQRAADGRDASSVSQSLAQMWSRLTPGREPTSYNNNDGNNGMGGQPFSQSSQTVPYMSYGSPPFSHQMSSGGGGDGIKAEPYDNDFLRNSGGPREKGEVDGSGRGLHPGLIVGGGKTESFRGRREKPRPFVCGVCMAAFATAPSLKIHLRKHCGHRPFHCNVCEATFASSSNLIRHQRIHTGERPFACTQCKAAFTHRGALVNHERVHTGQRPYVCDLCGAAFARCDALSRHKKTHKENRIKLEQEADGLDLFRLQS